MPTRRTLLKITAAATLSALAPPILAAPKRSGTTSHFNPNRSKPMTATLHYQNAELSYQLGGKADAPASSCCTADSVRRRISPRCCPACKRISVPLLSIRADMDAPCAATYR